MNERAIEMDQLVRTTLELEQYLCNSCGRYFYMNKMDTEGLEISLVCPYGCDEVGKHTRTIKTETKEVIDERNRGSD